MDASGIQVGGIPNRSRDLGISTLQASFWEQLGNPFLTRSLEESCLANVDVAKLKSFAEKALAKGEFKQGNAHQHH